MADKQGGSRRERREQYLHYAAEAAAEAERARDPEKKLSLLEIAAAWRRLADDVAPES